MALKEGNRFFQPSVAQYTSNFVEEESMFPEMLALAQRNQERKSLAQGQLSQSQLNINALDQHKEFQQQVYDEFDAEINKLKEDITTGASPDLIMGKLGAINQKYQRHDLRKTLESSYATYQTALEDERTSRKAGQFDPIYSATEGFVGKDPETGKINPFEYSGLKGVIRDEASLLKDVTADITPDSQDYRNLFKQDAAGEYQRDDQGNLIWRSVANRGIGLQKVVQNADLALEQAMEDPRGQYMTDKEFGQKIDFDNLDDETTNVDGVKYDLVNGQLVQKEMKMTEKDFAKNQMRNSIIRKGAQKLFSNTGEKFDIQHIADPATTPTKPVEGILPVSNTEYIPNLRAPKVIAEKDMKNVTMDALGNIQSPNFTDYETDDVNNALDTDIKVINDALSWFDKKEQDLLGDVEGETRVSAAKRRAERKYGKASTATQKASEYVTSIRQDYPNLTNENYSDTEVMDIYASAIQSLTPLVNRSLNIPDSETRNEFKTQIVGNVEASELTEADDLRGRNIYVFDGQSSTMSGGLPEVAEELGYKWKDKNEAVKSGQQEEFVNMLNDATVTSIGTHPKEKENVVFFMNVRDRNNATRRIAVSGDKSMSDSFSLASRAYKLMASGKSGIIDNPLFEFEVESSINPKTKQFETKLWRTEKGPNGEVKKEDRQLIDLSTLLQAGYKSYYDKYLAQYK